MNIKIGNRIISNYSEPFIIVEAGINHNGDIEKAYEMIVIAKSAGADAIKFQTFKAAEFVSNSEQLFTYKSQGKSITESMLKMFQRYEFKDEQWYKIKERCDREGILFFSTPQNKSDLDILLKLDIPLIKIGSDDFNNLPLITEYSKTGLPIILSMGMSELNEINESLDVIGYQNGYPVILLLCTSIYPTSPEEVNMLKLETLKKSFPDLIIGFSDHTQGSTAAVLAVGFGASVFEKHFTLDNNLPGPDHWFSENPQSIKNWIDTIRNAYIMMGRSEIKPTEKELEMKKISRRSIVAKRDIKEGEVFSESNISLMRPGNGLPPKIFNEIINLHATRFIKKGSLLEPGDFS